MRSRATCMLFIVGDALAKGVTCHRRAAGEELLRILRDRRGALQVDDVAPEVALVAGSIVGADLVYLAGGIGGSTVMWG
jgi:hypothetical protein